MAEGQRLAVYGVIRPGSDGRAWWLAKPGLGAVWTRSPANAHRLDDPADAVGLTDHPDAVVARLPAEVLLTPRQARLYALVRAERQVRVGGRARRVVEALQDLGLVDAHLDLVRPSAGAPSRVVRFTVTAR